VIIYYLLINLETEPENIWVNEYKQRHVQVLVCVV